MAIATRSSGSICRASTCGRNRAPGAIVAMGDSITDGTGSTVDANRRWPDFLARRLAAEFGDAAPGVLNVGIAGNRVLSHNAGLGILRRAGRPAPPDTGPPNPNALFGPSGLSRFDRDVLLQPGATHVIVLETTNDIGMAFDDPWPSVDDLIAGHRTLIQRAHAQGLTIYGGTLPPFEGAFYWTEAGEAKRQALNAWIRTSGAYDGVIDFDAAVRDPGRPTRFRGDLHAGDWLHPSDAGYEAMANAVDLSLFDPAAAADAAAGAAGPRTPWGVPDLGGVWDFRTLTPLERPAALGDQAVLTPEDAAEFRNTALESRNADRRDGGARRDVERAYNDFWWDYGDALTADLRTSLIVDPPDGRIPPRVDGVDEADQARRAARRRPVRERVVIGSPAHGPEDLGLSERCMLGFNAGPPMLPSAYNNNVHILQTPDHVIIFNEMVHDARIVPLGGVPHLPGAVRQWLGDPRGALGGRHPRRRVDQLHEQDRQLLHHRPRLRVGRDGAARRALHPRRRRRPALRVHRRRPGDVHAAVHGDDPDDADRRAFVRVRLSRGQLRHDEPAGRRAGAGTGRRRRTLTAGADVRVRLPRREPRHDEPAGRCPRSGTGRRRGALTAGAVRA